MTQSYGDLRILQHRELGALAETTTPSVVVGARLKRPTASWITFIAKEHHSYCKIVANHIDTCQPLKPTLERGAKLTGNALYWNLPT